MALSYIPASADEIKDAGVGSALEQSALRPLAEQGEAKAQFLLCLMEAEGTGGPHDSSDALKWCGAAAQQGNVDAEYNLALMYDNWHGIKQDHVEAMQWYQKAWSHGCTDAAYNLGFLFLKGEGVKQDYTQALEWFAKAADHDDVKAEEKIGFLYLEGKGVPRDENQARYWLRKAAMGGNSQAQFLIIRLYGDHIPVDDAERVAEWRDERGRQLAHTLVDLDSAYKTADYEAAKRIFQSLAVFGNAVGEERLAKLYDEGKGVPLDPTTAAYWYKKSAEGGNATAQFRLAEMDETADGVERDLVGAYRWFALAASHYTAAYDEFQGEATRRLGLLAAKMTPEQIERAQKLAKGWMRAK